MSHEPTATAPVECIRCPICQTPMRIEVPAKFECGKINQVTVPTDRVTGPIVWLGGN
jgi:hypothetical protein